MTGRVWVTADTHFGHAQATSLFARPVAIDDACAMDEFLLDRINSRVHRRDRLLHLGDFTGPRIWKGDEGKESVRYAAEIRARIACKSIELVRGNHDPARKRLKGLFDEVHEVLTFRGWSGGEDRVVCCHYPLRTWQGAFDGSMHLYGHTHGTCEAKGRSMDVGVDCWEYGPVLLDDVLSRLAAHTPPVRDVTPPRRQPMRRGIEDDPTNVR